MKDKAFEWDQLLVQHRELVRAISEQDIVLGAKIIDVHLNKVVVDLEHLRAEHSDYFMQIKRQPFSI